MTQPRRLSGPDHAQAIEHEVEGVLEAQCIITTGGGVRDCQVRKGVPFMDGAAVQALQQRRYSPARLSSGEPVEVRYLFRVRLQLP